MRRCDVTFQLRSRTRGSEGALAPSYSARQGHDGRVAVRGFGPAAAARHPRSALLGSLCGHPPAPDRVASHPEKTLFSNRDPTNAQGDHRPIFQEIVFFGVKRDRIQNRTRTRKQRTGIVRYGRKSKRAGNRPRPAPGLLTPGSRPPPRSSLVCSFAALNALKSHVLLRNSTGPVGAGTTTALLPAPALPATSTRPSDARPATAASCFTGVLLFCALCLHISRNLAEPHGVRRRRQYDHAARCSSAPRQLQLHAFDLLSSPC